MSSTPGRTLLGFQQQYQYPRPSSSKGPAAGSTQQQTPQSPPAAATAPSAQESSINSPRTKVTSPPPPAPAALPSSSTQAAPPPLADIPETRAAQSAQAPTQTASAIAEQSVTASQPIQATTKDVSASQTPPLNIDKSNGGDAAAISSWAGKVLEQAQASEQSKSPEPTSSTPARRSSVSKAVTPAGLVDYGSGRRRLSGSDNVHSPPELPSSFHSRRPSTMSSSSSSQGFQPNFVSENGLAFEDEKKTSLLRALGKSRDQQEADTSTASVRSNDSSASHRQSRRGYDGDVVGDRGGARSNEPRDLLSAGAMASRSSNDKAAADEADAEEPTPLSFLDEYSATPSPKARKRGVLLTPGGGRASRRFGSTAMSSGGESGSTHSRDTSILGGPMNSPREDAATTAPPQTPAPPPAPPVDDDAMSLAFHEVGGADGEEATGHGGGEDDDGEANFARGAVIFEAMSDAHSDTDARTPKSQGSNDDADSGKAAGSIGTNTAARGSMITDDAFRSNLLRESLNRQEKETPAYDEAWLHCDDGRAVKQMKATKNVPPPPQDAEAEAEAGEQTRNVSQDSSVKAEPLSETTTPYALPSRSPANKGNRRGFDYSSQRYESAPSPVGPPPLPARRKASTTYTDTPTREASPPPPLPQPDRDASPERRRRAALNKKARDDWEEHILKADWEELEVSRYLSLFGKDVHEVRSTAPLDPHNFTHSAFPSKIEWTNFDHDEPKFNASGYYIACLTALLSYLSPNQMVDLQRGTKHLTDEAEEEEDEDEFQQEFRLATLRASGQRLYYSALPLWEALGSRLRKTWRWESKSGSLLCLIGYTFLWWRGLLIASLIFSVIMLVLGLKSRPPPPDTLRDVLARQRRREEEERRQAQAVVPTSMRASAAPAAKRSQYSLVVEASQNYGLTASTLAGALADGHERAKNFGLWRSPRATWRLLFWLSISFFASLALKPAHLIRVPGAVLGILFFFIAPIVEHKPHWLGMEWSNPFDWIFAGVPNDAQYSMEVLRSRAQLGKPLVGDPALLMRPESEWKSQEVVTSTEGEEGSEKIDWTRWADLVLRGKSMAIRGTEVLAGSRSVQLPRVPVGTIDASTSRSSALLSHLSRGVNMGITALENKSKSTAAQQPSLAKGRGDRAVTAAAGATIDEADVDGTFWAVYDGCCGHVVITPHAVLFRSLFAKRPRGRRGLSLNASAGNVDDEQPLLDARTGQLTVPESELASESAPPPKVKVLFQCKLDAVKGIKKLASAGSRAGAMALGSSTWGLAAGEGLRLVLKGRRGEVDFYQVRGRDEAFNRLLALAPQQWQRVN